MKKKANNINYETGEVVCCKCKKYLGNYKTGNFYSLIRKKYCKDCAKAVKREQDRIIQKDRRKGIRQIKSEVRQALSELQNYTQKLEVCLGKRHVGLKELFQDYLKPLGYTGLAPYETREYIEEIKSQLEKTDREKENFRQVIEILITNQSWVDKLAECEHPEQIRQVLDNALSILYMTKNEEQKIKEIMKISRKQ